MTAAWVIAPRPLRSSVVVLAALYWKSESAIRTVAWRISTGAKVANPPSMAVVPPA